MIKELTRLAALRHQQWAGFIRSILTISFLSMNTWAAPITLGPYTGMITSPFTRGGTFVKSANVVNRSVTTKQTATSCTSVHHLDVPDPGSNPNTYIIWAAAAPNGYTGVFFGNSATGTSADSYTYNVSCGPCPAGTTINYTLSGSSVWNQYAGGAGVAKLTGSASATVTGTATIQPFVASPFTLGPTPATVTATPALGIATAGSTTNASTVLAGAAALTCPQTGHAISINQTVTASRTGGIVMATAAFIDLDWDPTTSVSCATVQRTPRKVSFRGHIQTEDFVLVEPPTYHEGLTELASTRADHAEALLATGDGGLIFAGGVDPSSPESFLRSGPVTRLLVNQDQATSALSTFSFSLVSSIVRGIAETGPFSTDNLIVLEGLGWNDDTAILEPNISALLTVDRDGVARELLLEQPLVAPSAGVFGRGGELFGEDLIVALPESGTLARVSAEGSVQDLELGMNLGTPIDLAFSSANSDFPQKLFVLDNGQRNPETGILQNTTGRVLIVDPDNGQVEVFAQSLNSPVALAFGDALVYGASGIQLFVLTGGTVDTNTGILTPGSGALHAYEPSGAETTLVETLDSPYDVTLRNPGTLTIATTTRLIDVGLPVPVEEEPYSWSFLTIFGVIILVIIGFLLGRRMA